METLLKKGFYLIEEFKMSHQRVDWFIFKQKKRNEEETDFYSEEKSMNEEKKFDLFRLDAKK